jgi:hypothetical protein
MATGDLSEKFWVPQKQRISLPNTSTIQERIHLIAFSLNSQNTFSASLNSLKNTKKVTLEEHKKFTTELMKNMSYMPSIVKIKMMITQKQIQIMRQVGVVHLFLKTVNAKKVLYMKV